MQSFNAHGHQPCSCTALDFCTARGLQPIRTRPLHQSSLATLLFSLYHMSNVSLVTDLRSTVSARRPRRLSSCLNEIANYMYSASAAYCKPVEYSRTGKHSRCVCVLFAFLEMQQYLTINPCLASAHIRSRYGRSRCVFWSQLAAA